MDASNRLLLVLVALGIVLAQVLAGPVAARQEPGAALDPKLELDRLVASIGRFRAEPSPAAVADGERALTLLVDHADAALEARIRIDLSWAKSSLGDTAAALEHARVARSLARAIGSDTLVASADYHLAVAHWYRSEHEQASSLAARAGEAYRELDDRGALARVLTLEGAMHRSRSEYADALGRHTEAMELARGLGDSVGVARSRNNIGLLHWDLGQNQRALEHLQAAIEVFEELGDRRRLAAALGNLGLVLIELDRPAEALPLLERGLALYREFGLARGEAKLLSNFAFAHTVMGDPEGALDYYDRALALREALVDHEGIARNLGSVAAIHLEHQRWGEALDAYSRALTAAEYAGARDEQVEIHAGLAATLEATGEYEGAVRSLRRQRELEDELELDGAAAAVEQLEEKTALLAKDRELEALGRARAEQEAALARQDARVVALVAGSALLGGLAVSLFVLYRSRARGLADLRRSHDALEEAAGRLTESERRYRSVFEDARVPKLVLDLGSGSILDSNEAFAILCGRRPAALRGSSLEDFDPPWLRDLLLALEPDLGEDVIRSVDWIDVDGGARCAEVWMAPLTLDGRPCAVVTLHDATEGRRLEEERIRSEKLESLGMLAGGIAHDFNNALVAVLGHVSIARYRSPEDSELRPLLRAAEDAIEHAKHLTQQLLAFSSGGAPRRELALLQRPLWNAVNLGLSGSNVRVEFDVAPSLWPAEVDVGQFTQVVSNLVINADQAMADGGLLVVRARNVTIEADLSAVAKPGRYVVIEFADRGPGIPVDVQSKILDPYFTTKDGGTGLGLATAFAIVKRHAGHLAFESVPGEGTTFAIYLPASSGEVAPTDVAPEALGEGYGRILVMDDDPMVQSVYRAALSELGYEFEVVADGQAALEAWDLAEGAGRPFDVVMMDLTVPGGMGGKETMAELLRRHPTALGVVASGYSKDPVMSNFREAGFAAALAKPFTITGLGLTLHQALERRPAEARRRLGQDA